ncbi:Glycine--tRNA ligase alpha subunit [Buchnera aphidicola (Anoecia corni)]|uniref:Glycine--tRNA ligase alpha subunit n=1 Tax=Buchnera aphidicola (Anoecia corni) TaxID=2994477 RepID=A0AAT9IFT7_9GAMM
MKEFENITFISIINILKKYWSSKGCVIIEPLDLPVGAGTFHPETFFNSIGKKSFSRAYVQASRRPSDGRFGKNPNRLQHYYQFQIIIKPAPNNIQDLFLNSLKQLNIHSTEQDIRFVEDNWENPTLGASGIGWEVWINGMEVFQFTYFQQVGGVECDPVAVEITYGLERLCMHIQNIDNVYDIVWGLSKHKKVYTYKELFLVNEKEQSMYNFKYSDTNTLFCLFEMYLKETERLLNLKNPLIIPAYENLLHAIHNFNLLDAKKVISVTERQNYILKIRSFSKKIANIYFLRENTLIT